MGSLNKANTGLVVLVRVLCIDCCSSVWECSMTSTSQGVVGAMVFSGLPFLSKKQREREQAVHLLRDAVIDAKDEARSARLSRAKDK